MAIELFQIEWTKLFPFNKAMNQPEVKEGGVYAIYISDGSKKKLQYFGKSKDFATRFGFHRQNSAHLFTEAQIKKCYVSFGLISSYEKSRMSNDVTPEQLRQIESYFINAIRPEGCDASTKKGYKGSPIIIVNTGKVIKPFEKVMTHNNDLIQLFKKNLKTSSKSSGSDWF